MKFSNRSQIVQLSLSEIKNQALWTGFCGVNKDPSHGSINDQIVMSDVYNYYGISGTYTVPTFIEYLKICQTRNKEAIIEINEDIHIASTANLLLKKFQKLCWADYGFQNSTACAYRALNNNQNIDVDLSVLLANDGQDIVKSTHEKHLLVNAWTVNDVNDRDKLIKLNVDQITGNVVW
ncbi:MAG: hypothetical protein LBP70_01235 [Mycoplasmataceae bacterium]|nr:hypothetical protein [Mycoplasmataceae bacterium]